MTRTEIISLIKGRLAAKTPFQLAYEINNDPLTQVFITPADIVALRDGTELDEVTWRSLAWIAKKWMNIAANPDDQEDEAPDNPALDSSFDLAEKNRVRQQLRAYMRKHGKGVPRLVARILGVPDSVPTNKIDSLLSGSSSNKVFSNHVKQMQRFLEPQNVADSFIAKCAEFLGDNYRPHSGIIAIQEGVQQFFGAAVDAQLFKWGDPLDLMTANVRGPFAQDSDFDRKALWPGYELKYIMFPSHERMGFGLRLSPEGLLSIVDLTSGLLYQGLVAVCSDALFIAARSLLSDNIKMFGMIPSSTYVPDEREIHIWLSDYRELFQGGFLRLVPTYFAKKSYPKRLAALVKHEIALERLCDVASF